MDRRDALKLFTLGAGSLFLPKDSFASWLFSLFREKNNSELIANFIKTTSAVNDTPVKTWIKEKSPVPVENNPTTRSIIFRHFIDQDIYSFILSLFNKFGNREERFIYKLVAEKIIQEFWISRQRNSIHDIVVPTKSVFESLVQEFTREDLLLFVRERGLDIQEYKEKLRSKDDYNFTHGHQIIKKYGHEFMPYNQVYAYFLALGFVDVASSYQWVAEDGSSMHAFRTGLEIKKSSFDTLRSFLWYFQKFANNYGGARVTVRGAREFWHYYDKYLDHSKQNFGRPYANIPDKAHYDSHELGNCIDLRASGKDGLLLYEYMRSCTWEKAIYPGRRQVFTTGTLSFEFMYHGGDPLGGHFHLRVGSKP